MTQPPNITAYLDTRREKSNGRFPVKIRVYHNNETRHYNTGIDLTEDEFKRSHGYDKERSKFKKTKTKPDQPMTAADCKEMKSKITQLLSKNIEAAEELSEFSFDKFERKILRPSGTEYDIFSQYQKVIDRLTEEGRIKTAIGFDLSRKSLKDFILDKKRSANSLSFKEVDPAFLENYEKWMIKTGRSETTVGIYTRSLRTLFNNAIAEGVVTADSYPFAKVGKKGYVIPAGSKTKRALNKNDLKKLRDYPLEDGDHMKKARDYWFFSYYGNGANPRDIAELKYENMVGEDTISFIRSKTKRTTKGHRKQIEIILNPFMKDVIARYGNRKVSPNTYIFPILEPHISPTENKSRVDAFVRFINQHMKRLAGKAGVSTDISTMWARHTYASINVQNGAPISLVQEGLGHTSSKTTDNYLNSFPSDIKRKFAHMLDVLD